MALFTTALGVGSLRRWCVVVVGRGAASCSVSSELRAPVPPGLAPAPGIHCTLHIVHGTWNMKWRLPLTPGPKTGRARCTALS
jgi:hypothetical protein